MRSLPSGLVAYKKTPVFDEQTVPAGLCKSHSTKAGTWGLINVIAGELLYRILEPEREEIILSPLQTGVVEPSIEHEVEPVGNVKFYVEFYK